MKNQIKFCLILFALILGCNPQHDISIPDIKLETQSPLSKTSLTEKAEILYQTLPNGSILEAGNNYIKILALKNTGITTWKKNYIFRIKTYSGERFTKINSFPLFSDIAPGGSLILSFSIYTELKPQFNGSEVWEFVSSTSNGNIISINSNSSITFQYTFKPPKYHKPIRPTNGKIIVPFLSYINGRANPHVGVDYESAVGSQLRSIGNGIVYKIKNNATSFGSINPDYSGPVVLIRYKLSNGAPAYAIYGHSANSWDDKTIIGKNFNFNCKYEIILKTTNRVYLNQSILKTAPFYNSKAAASHLHLCIFLPYKKNQNEFYEPPLSGWGYSPRIVTEGEYIDPETFFSQYELSTEI